MTATCDYHPDRPALDTCAHCEKSICSDCRDIVAGRAVCRPCVEAIRARVSQTVAAPPEPSSTFGTVLPGSIPMAGTMVGGYAPAPAVARPTGGAGRVVLGVFLAFLAGLVSTVAWFAIVLLAKSNLSLCAVGVGWIIGYTLVKVSGRGGLPLATVAGILSLIFCGSAMWLFGGGSIDIIGFVFVAIGVYSAVMVPLRTPG